MLAVQGIYNGRTIESLQPLPQEKKFRVFITFLEEIKDADESNIIRDFSAQSSGFSFWNDEKEDIYQDYLGKK